MSRFQVALIAAFALAGSAAGVVAQTGLFDEPQRSVNQREAVEYLYPEQVSVVAGKPTPVELHFRIAPGLHINSHTPKDKYLIPTVFSIPDSAGVVLNGASYPVGVDFVLPADPQTRLNVYTGEFTIDTRLVAEPGDHLVQGKLRYQACDQNACMPPRTIPVAIDVVGKPAH